MKKLLYILFTTTLLFSCNNDDDTKVKLPKQDLNFNPIEGNWIEESYYTDENNRLYKWSKAFSNNYIYTVDTYKQGEHIVKSSYKYAIDSEYIYFDDGSIYFYKISNDTLYMSRNEIDFENNNRISISVKQ